MHSNLLGFSNLLFIREQYSPQWKDETKAYRDAFLNLTFEDYAKLFMSCKNIIKKKYSCMSN